MPRPSAEQRELKRIADQLTTLNGLVSMLVATIQHAVMLAEPPEEPAPPPRRYMDGKPMPNGAPR